jgi:hypothetical protein
LVSGLSPADAGWSVGSLLLALDCVSVLSCWREPFRPSRRVFPTPPPISPISGPAPLLSGAPGPAIMPALCVLTSAERDSGCAGDRSLGAFPDSPERVIIGWATEAKPASLPPRVTVGGVGCWLSSALAGCGSVSGLTAAGAGSSGPAALVSGFGTGAAGIFWDSMANIWAIWIAAASAVAC